MLVVDAFNATWLSVGQVGVFASLAAMVATLGGEMLADRRRRVAIVTASFLLGAVAFSALPWAPRLEVAYSAYFLTLPGRSLQRPGPGRHDPGGSAGRLSWPFPRAYQHPGDAGDDAGLGARRVAVRPGPGLPFTLAGALELTLAIVVLTTLRAGDGRPRR